MVKVTLNDNLVPCEREPWALGRPAHDLTNNIVPAEQFIAAAIKFFAFRRGSVRYSGHISPGNKGLQVKVWDGEQLYRTIRFRSRNFTGILHVVPVNGHISHCLGHDAIGDIGAVECVAGYS